MADDSLPRMRNLSTHNNTIIIMVLLCLYAHCCILWPLNSLHPSTSRHPGPAPPSHNSHPLNPPTPPPFHPSTHPGPSLRGVTPPPNPPPFRSHHQHHPPSTCLLHHHPSPSTLTPSALPAPPPPETPPLSELGHLAAAKEAFNEVIRATSRTKGFVKLPEAYVNIGHLGLAKKQYADALRMYELAGRMNNQRDVKVGTQTGLMAGLPRGRASSPPVLCTVACAGFDAVVMHAVMMVAGEGVPGMPVDAQRLRELLFASGLIYAHRCAVL